MLFYKYGSLHLCLKHTLLQIPLQKVYTNLYSHKQHISLINSLIKQVFKFLLTFDDFSIHDFHSFFVVIFSYKFLSFKILRLLTFCHICCNFSQHIVSVCCTKALDLHVMKSINLLLYGSCLKVMLENNVSCSSGV